MRRAAKLLPEKLRATWTYPRSVSGARGPFSLPDSAQNAPLRSFGGQCRGRFWARAVQAPIASS
eukprot:9050888-Alexandrium_andersonii.AAC.1